jgi:hypothetical protein
MRMDGGRVRDTKMLRGWVRCVIIPLFWVLAYERRCLRLGLGLFEHQR